MSGMSHPPGIRPAALFWVGFFVESALVGLAMVVAWIAWSDPFAFPVRFDARSLGVGLLATVPPALYAVFALTGPGLRIGSLRRIHDILRDLLGDAVRALTLWQLLLLAAAAGFGEEILFRGVFQPLSGLLVSSIVFALLHAVTPAYAVLAFVFSLYLGGLYTRTGNLAEPITVHAVYDAWALLLLRRRFRAEGAASSGGGPGAPEQGDDAADRDELPPDDVIDPADASGALPTTPGA